MFRFILEVAFIRRVLQVRFVRIILGLAFLGALVAGLFYAVVVFNAVQQRSDTHHVEHHSSR